MAKVQIKSERITPFGGIFSIMEQFDALLSNVIDSTSGLRSRTLGYQYSEIFRPETQHIYTVIPAYARVFNDSD